MSDESLRAAGVARRLVRSVVALVGSVRVERSAPPARIAPAALLGRAGHLLVRAGLLGADGDTEGVGVLVRTALESATYAVWVLGDSDRFDRLNADYARYVRLLNDGAMSGRLTPLLDGWPASERLVSFERVVGDVADWLAGRSDPGGGRYRELYSGLYRSLSTFDVHGLGPVERYVIADGTAVVIPPRPGGMAPGVAVALGALVLGLVAEPVCASYRLDTVELVELTEQLYTELASSGAATLHPDVVEGLARYGIDVSDLGPTGPDRLGA